MSGTNDIQVPIPNAGLINFSGAAQYPVSQTGGIASRMGPTQHGLLMNETSASPTPYLGTTSVFFSWWNLAP